MSSTNSGLLSRTLVRALPLLLAGAAVVTPAQSRAGELLVVFDIQDSSGTLRRNEAGQLSLYLASRMAEKGGYQVVPRSRVLTQIKKKHRRACIDWACQSAVGWDFKASKVLGTRIMKLGSQCMVTATLYDLKSKASQASATIKGECTPDAFVEAADKVPDLLAGEMTARPKPVATPRPVVRPKPVVRAKTSRPKPVARAKPARPKPVARPGHRARAKPARPKPVARAKKINKPSAMADEPGLSTPQPASIPSHKRALLIKASTPSRQWPLWPALAAAGAAVAGIAVGIPLLAIHNQPHDCDGDPKPDASNCRQLYDTQTLGWVLTGAGIGALAAGGVLFYLHMTTGPKQRRTAGLDMVTVSPVVGGAVMGAVGRF